MRGRRWLRCIYPTRHFFATPLSERVEALSMLTIYRRHVKKCPHRSEGRKYRRCRCPIWIDGFVKSLEVRQSLKERSWEAAELEMEDLKQRLLHPEEAAKKEEEA